MEVREALSSGGGRLDWRRKGISGQRKGRWIRTGRRRFSGGGLCYVLSSFLGLNNLHGAVWICVSQLVSINLSCPIGSPTCPIWDEGKLLLPKETTRLLLICADYSTGHVAWLPQHRLGLGCPCVCAHAGVCACMAFGSSSKLSWAGSFWAHSNTKSP